MNEIKYENVEVVWKHHWYKASKVGILIARISYNFQVEKNQIV